MQYLGEKHSKRVGEMVDTQESKRKNYDSVDFLKFILSLFVVAIHSGILPSILYPWLRVAVPIFFIISSYFFFSNLSGIPQVGKTAYLKKFLIRNLQLYLFWFILLFPVTIVVRGYFSNGILHGLLNIVHDFLFASTFKASWYIIALCLSTTIVYLLSKCISTNAILMMTFPVYVFCCLFTSYYSLVSENELLVTCYEGYLKIFQSPTTNFSVALFWIALGKKISEKEYFIDHKKMLFLFIPLCLMLYLEFLFVKSISDTISYSSYFMLIPLCAVIFIYVKNLNMTLKYHAHYRRLSTIIYCLHATVILMLSAAETKLFSGYSELFLYLNYPITVLICFLVYIMSHSLRRFNGFAFLKYAE